MILLCPLQRPLLKRQNTRILDSGRDEEADFTALVPHPLDGPSNGIDVSGVPRRLLNVLEPEHMQSAVRRLQAEAGADVLGIVAPRCRAAEPGSEGAEVFLEEEGGGGSLG
jgi:hypothetical protein